MCSPRIVRSRLRPSHSSKQKDELMNTITKFLAIALIAALPSYASAQYVQVYDLAAASDGTGQTIDSIISDGTTTYNLIRATSPTAGDGFITKVTDAGGGSQATSILMTSAQYGSVAGATANLGGFYGVDLVGDDITFVNFFDNAVYQVDKVSGTPTQVTDATLIGAFTGVAPNLISANTANPAGGAVLYDSITDTILAVDSAGALSTFVSNADLMTTQGNDTIGSGMAMIGSEVYWGDSTSDGLYKSSGGVGSPVLTQAQIIAVTGETGAGFGDIFAAPDSLIYYYDSTADSILSFDPANAASTLSVVLSESQLNAGPANTDSVGNLSWFKGGIAWAQTAGSGGRIPGYYAIPEPSSMLLLGLGMVTLVSRKRS